MDDETEPYPDSAGASELDSSADLPDAAVPVPPPVRVTLLLADSAQVADRKLYVLGGGITLIGPRPQPLGVAIRIEVPWDRANISHTWRLDLLDEDGRPVTFGEKAVVVTGRFEAGRPAGPDRARLFRFRWPSTFRPCRSWPDVATPGSWPSTRPPTTTGARASMYAPLRRARRQPRTS